MKIIVGILLLSCITATYLQAEVKSPMDAQQQVMDRLLDGDAAGKRILSHPDLLPAGTPVESWHDVVMVTPAEGYVVFIDEMAYANFCHPCRYVFVDRNSGAIQVEHAQKPPKDAMTWREMETEAFTKLMAAGNRRAPRKVEPAQPGKSTRGGELYAVLMNGGASQWSNHVRYWNDLSNIYITLVDVYGYKDENIIVLCSDGLNPAPDQSNGQNSHPDLDGDGDDDIMYSTTYANVSMVFDDLVNTLTTDDQLFIFVTDHGSSAGGWSTDINLWNYEILHDSQWQTMIDALPPLDIIVTLEPCFSGGFEDNTTHIPPRVFSSACSHLEYSWAMPPDYVYDTYVFFWTAAVKWEDAYGVPCDADLNGNDLIDMHEAFIYAEEHDFSDETPQYDSNPTELGDELTLFGSGKVWYVPDDFATIQAAIDAAEDKDTVRVAAGTYSEGINFLAKKITVESLEGPLNTVIDGTGNPFTVVMEGLGTVDSTLKGFTIQGGDDAGISCAYDGPTIICCRIIDNGGPGTMIIGGGVSCVTGGNAHLIDCLIAGNQANSGGGVGADDNCYPSLVNCTVIDNVAVSGGGIFNRLNAQTTVKNSIIWNNVSDQIYNSTGTTTTVTYSNVMDGYTGEGNIDRDPVFADGDGRLAKTSPCINMADVSECSPEDLDIYGNARILNGCVDMGACEASEATLMADAFTLIPRLPGQIMLDIDFGASFAGRSYAMAGSASGLAPGIVIYNTTIPLNWDAYTDVVLINLNTPVFLNFAGALDGNGQATATLSYPGGGNVAWVGMSVNHAAFTHSPVDTASNPVPVTFVDEE
ncbi:MAG: C13 family peptidase [Planctomycetota bacterium]|jgi:hypothetical protein